MAPKLGVWGKRTAVFINQPAKTADSAIFHTVRNKAVTSVVLAFHYQKVEVNFHQLKPLMAEKPNPSFGGSLKY